MKWMWAVLGAAVLIAVVLSVYYANAPAAEPAQPTGIEVDIDGPKKQKPPKPVTPRKAARR